MTSDDEFIRKILDDPQTDARKWQTSDGVIFYPLVGWEANTLPNNLGLLKIEFLTASPQISARTLRLGIARPQAAELSKVLDQLARAPHVTRPAKPN